MNKAATMKKPNDRGDAGRCAACPFGTTTTRRPIIKNHLLLPAVCLFAGLSFAAGAQAQSTTTSPPALTAAQQAYQSAQDDCLAQYKQQNIPKSQIYSFTRRCLAGKGITKAVAMPPPAAMAPSP
jgi:hypothetical protein